MNPLDRAAALLLEMRAERDRAIARATMAEANQLAMVCVQAAHWPTLTRAYRDDATPILQRVSDESNLAMLPWLPSEDPRVALQVH